MRGRKPDHTWDFRLLDAFRRYQQRHDAPPTVAELSMALKQDYGWLSPSVFKVHRLLQRLVKYGYLRKSAGSARRYRLTASGKLAGLDDFPVGALDVLQHVPE